ncbi:putative GPI anchored protein [Trichophyton interdigitale]|uniref:GPI anchored protein n=1 Tax=Trichophyton interdigitale TaxID=101480 RepID=A0A9P4YFG3_9EURO|nr:putative GPI anchored protein [Trichophyton interdigitale]KAF3895202.1 putative GPI anchored protein [Trichophyton interdigitale]KAG8209847.1 putative GPI anchored protein [Trichophyton interdigitale]
MRSVLYLLFAAVAAAASLENPFSVPPGGYRFSAGTPTVLTWKPTTPGTVTLKLHMSSDITPQNGRVLVAHLENGGSYTFLPPSDLPQGGKYTIQILDDNDPNQYNFTPTFMVDGATGSPTTGPTTTRASMTTSEATTSDETTTTRSPTRSSTVSPTTTSDSSSSDTTMSTVTTSSSTPTTTDSTSTSESASESTTESSTRSSSTGMPTSSGAPDPNGAVSLALPGGLLSIVLTLMALL